MIDGFFDDDTDQSFDDLIEASWREFTDDLAARLGDLRYGTYSQDRQGLRV
ncbi:hypothetical protein IA539_05820 [Gordonia sp. zg691]|uniref:hypothetical protein n=1 Tax=Gordonia jinghuaiqii TaxID=2758710 RepID=UPI001662594F|nr:hypothetical protein [Gordonia jinghuaiqii]MBD0860725.1 hypothetical protein [Gordonia jinghuaiqii]